MSDDAPAVRWEWRLALGALVLLFAAGNIVWLELYGKSENLLHQNALSWSYITGLVVVVGLLFSAAAAQYLPALLAAKK